VAYATVTPMGAYWAYKSTNPILGIFRGCFYVHCPAVVNFRIYTVIIVAYR